VTHESGRLTIKHPMAGNGGKKDNIYAVRAAFVDAKLGPKRVDLSLTVEQDDESDWDEFETV